MKALLKLIVVLCLAMLARTSLAENFPDHQIKIINPYAAGGTDGFFAQLVAKSLSQQFGQDVIVEPHPGAGGNIGSALVARAEPDGYTLLAGTSGSNAVNPSLYRNLPYNAKRDLRLVATLATTDNVLVVGASSPFKSVKDIIEYAKAHPGAAKYASSGVGSVLHLSGAMFAHLADINMVHVAYKGTAPALIDVIGGRVAMMFANAPSVVNLVKDGKLRALAVSGSQHSDALPGVPTMQEAGVPGFDLVSWFGIMAPYKTPDSVVTKLNAAINKMLHEPETKERFASQGATPMILDAPASEEFFVKQLKVWHDVVETSGAHVD